MLLRVFYQLWFSYIFLVTLIRGSSVAGSYKSQSWDLDMSVGGSQVPQELVDWLPGEGKPAMMSMVQSPLWVSRQAWKTSSLLLPAHEPVWALRSEGVLWDLNGPFGKSTLYNKEVQLRQVCWRTKWHNVHREETDADTSFVREKCIQLRYAI